LYEVILHRKIYFNFISDGTYCNIVSKKENISHATYFTIPLRICLLKQAYKNARKKDLKKMSWATTDLGPV